jgi:membrane-associated phospholipid phosphatase
MNSQNIKDTILKHFSCLVNLMIAILILTAVSSAHGQEIKPSSQAGSTPRLNTKEESNTNDYHLDKAYFKSYLTDTAHLLSSPLRWDKYDWLTASLVIGATAGLYAFDQNIHDWAQKRRGKTTDHISSVVKVFGQGQYIVPALGLFYLYGYAAENSKAEETALLGVESFLISGAFTQVLKFSTHRYRPEDSDRYDRWDGPSFSGSNLSFASGDATAAFSVATVIASEYDDKAWVPPLAYSIATLTALARINDNAHWASDVFAGAAIGYFTAKTIVKLHKKGSRFAVAPAMTGQGPGLVISYKF